MTTATAASPRADRAVEALRRSGNPFRNYFARNPDDEVCARYHVPELYAAERVAAPQHHRPVPLRPDDALGSRARPRATRGPARRTCSTRSSTAATGPGNCSSRPASTRRTATSSNTCCSRSSTRCSAAASSEASGRSTTSASTSFADCSATPCSALTTDQKLDLFPAPGSGGGRGGSASASTRRSSAASGSSITSAGTANLAAGRCRSSRR